MGTLLPTLVVPSARCARQTFGGQPRIQVIKHIPGVRYVVAPYEADAQLGFLARNGHIDAVITEDSDVLLFGCPRVVFKLDRDGAGQEVNLREAFSRRCQDDSLAASRANPEEPPAGGARPSVARRRGPARCPLGRSQR